MSPRRWEARCTGCGAAIWRERRWFWPWGMSERTAQRVVKAMGTHSCGATWTEAKK